MLAYQNFKDKSVLVTGGAGFIGSNLSHKLVSYGAKVTIIDSFMKDGGANRFNLNGIKKDITLIKADLTKESSQKYVKDFDIIFNLAAQIGHKESVDYPISDLNLNAVSSLNILEAVRKNKSDTTIVYTGTRNQYGKIIQNPVTENHPIIPVDPNGISKHAAEQYHLLDTRKYGIKTTSLRLTNIYGPRVQIKTSKQGFIGWFINLALKNQEITIHGDGNQLRDVLHVDDVSNALMLASKNKNAIGESFNIASGESVSVKDIAQMIVKYSGSGKIKMIPQPVENKKIEIGDFCGDISKAKKMFGWTPEVEIDKGMKETVEFFKKNIKYYG